MRYREVYESNLKLLKGDLPRIRGSYGAFIITMDPLDFLKLTAPEADFERIKARKFPHDKETFAKMIGDEKVDDYHGRFNIPFLTIEWPSGKVVGHEGRHRAWMVHQQGGTKYPMAIYMRHPNEYSVTYEEYRHDSDETTPREENFGTDYEAARKRADELKNHGQRERDAWQAAYDAGKDFELSAVSYYKVKVETYRPGDIKGSPNYTNPDDPWDRKPYQVADMPKQLLGQYDQSIVVTNYQVGLVKGYQHFSESVLQEIEHEPQHPYQDKIAVPALDNAYRRCKRDGLVNLGKLDDFDVVSSGPLDDGEMVEIFLVRDGNPCAEFTLGGPRGRGERNVASVYVRRECRGIGYRLYRLMLSKGIVLRSGRTQTDDGRRMWTKLMQDPAVEVLINYDKPVETLDDIELAYSSKLYFLTAKLK